MIVIKAQRMYKKAIRKQGRGKDQIIKILSTDN